MDYSTVLFDVIFFSLVFGLIFRKRLRARFARWRKPKAPARFAAAAGTSEPQALTARLYELEKIFGPFGGNTAAHPSALYALPEFAEAARLLGAPSVAVATLLQYVEGSSWGLSSAALVALRIRAEGGEAIERVLRHCPHYSPWAIYFALEYLADQKPRVPVGAPLMRAKDWWIDNRWMPNIFRDYLECCAAQGDVATFGTALSAPDAAPHHIVRQFLHKIVHPSAATLVAELDNAPAPPTIHVDTTETTLAGVGRFWDSSHFTHLAEPARWRQALQLAEAMLQQHPPRCLLVSGEPLVGKSSFLELLARRIAASNWRVFEASGADLQADQVYIGQLEGRLRQLIDELAKGHKLIWYIPEIVQLATSGRHMGQSATMLDQIIPAIAAGRIIVWCEATPKGTARLMQIKPSLRGLFETVAIEAMSPAETLTLARQWIEAVHGDDDKHGVRFHPDCAEVAVDCASQYLGASGLPGSALLMLRLTAARTEFAQGGEIAPRSVLETLAQLSGLPLSILDTREQLDLGTIRDFFNARVMGQDEAVEAVVARLAMLKAGLNDPDKPIGVFLFAGPTGTGKTELAKAVSEFLFGSVERMIRLDMSEFQTHESIAKILGQSGGGATESDSLVTRVRKQPFSVLLLDEFEKSHPMIWDLFLQAFDEGRLTDALGQTADLRHCLIILTSNLGATAHRSLGLGFAPQADEFTKEQVLRAIRETYRPEFQNRLDKVIVFRPLTRELMRGILRKELAALLERRGLKDRAWAIEWESSALEFLLRKGFSPEMGARPLKRAIDQYVVAPLAAIIVEKRFPEGEQFLFVRGVGETIEVEFIDPDADLAAAKAAPAPLPVEPAALSALASAVLAPKGSHAEFEALQAEYDGIARTLNSEAWSELKEKLTIEMSAAEFWSRPDRFATLARFALMDRVKAAAETADALRRRLARHSRPPRHYSAELSGRFALQLHVIREGIKDALDNEPIELALTIEPVFDGAGEREATLAWCDKLAAMYRAWAAKRRMHSSEMPSAQKGVPMLLVSGFGAHRTLAPEAGLHVFETSEGGAGRVTARVRLATVPLGDVPAAKERKLVLQALDDAPRPNGVVRRYREEPPLVRDTGGQWRTGRIDLVLGGAFDLFQTGPR